MAPRKTRERVSHNLTQTVGSKKLHAWTIGEHLLGGHGRGVFPQPHALRQNLKTDRRRMFPIERKNNEESNNLRSPQETMFLGKRNAGSQPNSRQCQRGNREFSFQRKASRKPLTNLKRRGRGREGGDKRGRIFAAQKKGWTEEAGFR